MEHRDLRSRLDGQLGRTNRSRAEPSRRCRTLALSTEFYGRLERGATLPSVPTCTAWRERWGRAPIHCSVYRRGTFTCP